MAVLMFWPTVWKNPLLGFSLLFSSSDPNWTFVLHIYELNYAVEYKPCGFGPWKIWATVDPEIKLRLSSIKQPEFDIVNKRLI